MRPHFLTMAMLVAALTLYVAGLGGGGSALVAGGGVFALGFWGRFFRHRHAAA
jgi:hypothetical protein